MNNLCVARDDSKNEVNFAVRLAQGAPELVWTGNANPWILGLPYTTTLVRRSDANGPSTWGKVANIGLAQGSDDGKHGYCDAWVTVQFPSKGSISADVSYAKTFVKDVLIQPDFEALD